MSAFEISERIRELRELRRMADELAAEIEAIQDGLKAEMTARQTDELTGTDFKLTWKNVVSSRIDTTALKKELPDVAAQFTRQSMSRRFLLV